MKLFSILKKPNELDKLAEGDTGGRGILSNVRLQIKILHSLGVCYVLAFCLAVNFASVFLGLPTVFAESDTKLVFAQAVMWYICFSIISNYLLILYHSKKSHFGPGHTKNLPFNAVNKTKKYDWSSQAMNSRAPSDWLPHEGSSAVNEKNATDWTVCSHCDINVPPRTRHCAICQVCVLKKDHHCFFTGCCIGFYNQKHFIIFCIYGILGGTWGLYNLSSYLSLNYAPLLSLQVYMYFVPYCFLAFIFGYISFYYLCLIFLLYLHITSTCAALYYFSWQMLVIYRGQTTYEFMKGRKMYSDDLKENLRSVFGRNWIVPLIIPIPLLLNEGDGMSWRVTTKFE